jgi:anti-sigma factor RsiW
MKPHFSEADLLETYYMRPGESMPVMMHLADCADCAARYERLETKMQSLRSCAHDEKPETFWARQRISVMRRIDARRSPRIARYAAAAALVLAIGGAAVFESSSRRVVKETPTTMATPLEDSTTRRLEDSPWQSEELAEYSQIVEWESWVENGDQS